MERVIVAFERDKSCWRIKEVLEASGTVSCTVCRSAAEVKRAVRKQYAAAVVCGYKFADESAEGLFCDLPSSCAMLVVAAQGMLDMIGNEDIFKLAAPVSRGDLLASVRMLLQMGRRIEKFVRPQRPEEEKRLIGRAKEVLMGRNGMTEAQAHRFLQKRSMDSGLKLAEAARLVVNGVWDM